jgi:hypothetical protein
MKKGIQNMKQFMQEQTTLGLTPATASYYELSDTRAAAQAIRDQPKARMLTTASRRFRVSSTATIPYKKPALCGSSALAGFWPPVLLAASDAQWRAGAVWGS